MRKLKFKLVKNVIPLYGTSYTTCISCDIPFNETLNIKKDCIEQTRRASENSRNTWSSTYNSSTSQSSSHTQQQPMSSNTVFVRSNDNVGVAGTSGISGRHTQSQHSNVSRLNRPNIDKRTRSNNRENHTSWVNSDDFNSSWDESDQSTSRDSRNANITTNKWGNVDNNTVMMCNCHESAIKLTVKKEGPNKGNNRI